MVANGGWIYCASGPSLYFPFLDTCPKCSIGQIRPVLGIKGHKPNSDPIGQICGETILAIFSEVFRLKGLSVRLAKSTNRQGDVDFAVYDEAFLALAEVKASPLVLYAIGLQLKDKMEDVVDGEKVAKADHSPATIQSVESAPMTMYVANRNRHISIGPKSHESWPFKELSEYVADLANLEVILEAWKEVYDGYVSEWAGSAARNRWMTAGCGGKVDDSKNLPGLDRTDDIKKGTYQVLKYGTSYKEPCTKRLVRALLVSNLKPVKSWVRYLADVQDVLWTKPKYRREAESLDSSLVAFQKDGVFNLYDGIVCLTGNVVGDAKIGQVFDWQP